MCDRTAARRAPLLVEHRCGYALSCRPAPHLDTPGTCLTARVKILRSSVRTLSTMVKAPLAPPGSALLEDLTGHKSTFAASELWAKNSAVIFVARRPG